MIATPQDIHRASSLLREGKLVAFPTETVYGLGGNALSDDAVAAIYAAKSRPDFNPLIVHVRSIEDANHYVEFNEMALQLARKFWPGPLTLVLPRRKNCKLSLLVSAGMDTVAVRMPAHPLAQALLHEAAIPIAAPSANRSGRISPTDASHVREELGDRIAMILDGGPCHIGIESTVVDTTGDAPVILRPGSVTAEEINSLPPCGGGLGRGGTLNILDSRAFVETTPSPRPSPTRGEGEVKSPGQLASHYAPSKPVRLNAMDVQPDEALLAFGTDIPSGALHTENLSATGNLQEAAANLFRMLRLLDTKLAKTIAVMPIPHHELGIAINDRLTRAATR